MLSSGQRSRVSRIVTFDGDIQEAFAGQSVTLCLADEVDISRGDMLAHPNNMPHQSRTVEAMLVWMHADKLEPGRRYLLKQTSQTVRAVITRLHYRVDPNTLHRDGNADTLNLNAIGRVTIECFKPLYWDPYNTNRATGAAVLIDPMTHATVGAVMIIERLVQPDPVQDDKTRNLRREPGLVSAGERRALMRQKPVTLWFTGLSGAGKSSIAQAVEQRLIALGHPAYVLDGDNLRHGLNRDLGFSAEDRTENIRRVAEVAALFNDAGLIAITAFISPYRDDRQRARERIGAERFIEVHVDTPLEICEQRDPKGLYRKARRGDMVDFTGLQSPYEEPLNPELRIDAGSSAVDACAELVIATLRERGIIPEAP